MAGSRSARKLQIGKETVAGTAVAATTILRAFGTIEDQRTVVFPPEDSGYIPGLDRAYVPKLLAALDQTAVPATFEQLPYLFEASIKAVTTGTGDGTGGSGYKYVYTAPTTVKNTINTYTIEGGDDQEAERMEYSFVTDWELSGKAGEALMMTSKWVGRQVALNAYTGALSLPAIEDALFSKSKLWIDAVGGTIGTTLVSSSFLGMSFKYKSGWIPVFTADGNLYFTFAKETTPELVVDITFEHDAAGTARKVDWRAGTARQFRIQTSGSSYATPGTGTLNTGLRTIRLDFAAKVEKVTKLDEQDGNDILTATLRGRYNTTAAKFFEATVTNELTALP